MDFLKLKLCVRKGRNIKLFEIHRERYRDTEQIVLASGDIVVRFGKQ